MTPFGKRLMFNIPVEVNSSTKTNLYQERDGDEDGEDEHATQPVEVQSSPAHAVHERHDDQRHGHHNGSNADSHELGGLLCQTRTNKQPCRVVEHLK